MQLLYDLITVVKKMTISMTKSYVIKGKPVPLARPRFVGKHVYDEQKQEKILFGWELRAQNPSFEVCEIRMEIEFCMPICGCSKKQTAEMVGRPHGKRPDLDNLIKFVLDASLGILFEDDSLVSEIVARKVYMLIPCTRIKVSPYGEEQETYIK